jgi:hypothetical protein
MFVDNVVVAFCKLPLLLDDSLNAMTGDNGTSKKSRQAIVEKTDSKSNFFIVNDYSF